VEQHRNLEQRSRNECAASTAVAADSASSTEKP
jgi:hypothetical protein